MHSTISESTTISVSDKRQYVECSTSVLQSKLISLLNCTKGVAFFIFIQITLLIFFLASADSQSTIYASDSLKVSAPDVPLSKKSRSPRKFSIVARTLDRYGISDRAGAAIVSATLQDIGEIKDNDCSNVVDRNLIRRNRLRERNSLTASSSINDVGTFGLFFDGRKDKTYIMVDRRRKIVVEEHISMIKEPGSEYMGHVSPTNSTAVCIKTSILGFFFEKSINLDMLVALGCDGTVTNTGSKGGIIRLFELELKRPVQWLICQLHANELPLRHLFEHLDGSTSGPRAFSGPLGKALVNCEKLKLVLFENIECELPIISKEDLSSDQKYLLDICRAVSSGLFSQNLAQRNPGKMVHSRWLTTANRILRLYVSSENPTQNLITLAVFVMKVYAPMWFSIKMHSSCVNGAKHLYQTIALSRYMPQELRDIIDPVIQRNGFFGHPENILLAMLFDNNNNIRELATRRILKVRRTSRSSTNVRNFCRPKLNFSATNYTELINWQNCNVTEPPFTRALQMDIIENSIETQNFNLHLNLSHAVQFPCHTQAVERCVKSVTEASSNVCGPIRRDGFIRARNKSRKVNPSFNTKCTYRTK